MQTITETARQFFDACETGQGWAGCGAFCTPTASFTAQAAPLAGIRTLQEYTEWMKALLGVLPDGHYQIKAFATDLDLQSVCAYGVFRGTHSGSGGPIPPTGRSTQTDYVYVMQFEDDRIAHMTKVWNAPYALAELGWVPVPA